MRLADRATIAAWLAEAEELERRAQAKFDEASAIYERFEHGQPIILNHHSTRQARRDRNRADDRMCHGHMLEERAAELRTRAANHENEHRRRAMKPENPVTREDVSPGDIVFRKPMPGSLAPDPYRVVRANAKTVSVETGHSWTDRIPYEELVGVTKAGAK